MSADKTDAAISIEHGASNDSIIRGTGLSGDEWGQRGFYAYTAGVSSWDWGSLEWIGWLQLCQ